MLINSEFEFHNSSTLYFRLNSKMTYPNPLKVVTRSLTPNILISSCSFKRFDKVNFGARMALFNYDNSVIVWSAIPYGEEVDKAIQKLTGGSAFDVTHLIIPDKEHTMAAKSFKEKYPAMKIIAMESVDLGESCPIDYTITSKYANKLIDASVLEEIGIKESAILKNFQFVYLPHHANKELVTYDLNSKILFEADLLFNLGNGEKLEQFSPETGYPEDYNPYLGWSYSSRYLHPDSTVGRFLLNKICNTAQSAEGLKTIYNWDFKLIVMCHGNVIEHDAKTKFKTLFSSVL